MTIFTLAASQRLWQRLRQVGIGKILATAWSYLWMRLAGLGYGEPIAIWIATWFAPPYKHRRPLARYSRRGYIAPSATVSSDRLQRGANIFLGERVGIFSYPDGGSVVLGERVYLHNDTVLQTAAGGKLVIGKDTHVQPRCQLIATRGSIYIGSRVQIAPDCGFDARPLQQRGHQLNPSTAADITIEDDVWIGHGVTVLAGVTIGAGAVVGSGAVVTADLPQGAIAVGMPARTVKMRTDSNES